MKKMAILGVFLAATVEAVAHSSAMAANPPETAGRPDSLQSRLVPVSSGGLTSDQVAARAQETSFDAAARRQALASAEARLEQAKNAYYPKLTLTGSYQRLSDLSQPAFNVGSTTGGTSSSPFQIVIPLNRFLLQATLTVPISDYVLRLSQSYAAASRNQRAAQLDQQAARLKAGTDGKVAYYAWLRARGQLAVAERAVEQSKAHLQDAHNAFEVGTSSKADVLRVESQLARAELIVAQAQNLAEINEEQIRIAMHDTSGRRYQVGEDLRLDPPPLTGLDDLAALRAEALDRRLEVRALDETAWSLREQARVARAGNYPRLDVFGNAIYANPNPRIFIPDNTFRASWDAGVQLVWTPNDTLNAAPASADAEARAAQTEMQKEALRDSVKMEVMQAFNAMREAEVSLQTTARGLAAAEEGYRVRRELFQSGRATSVELTDAEVELFRASLDAINARTQLHSARASLLHAVGRDIPTVMAKR
jgi:outer membrane protein